MRRKNKLNIALSCWVAWVILLGTIIFLGNILPSSINSIDSVFPAIASVASYILGGILWMVGCGFYAEYKGYSAIIGILLGLFSVIGLIILLILPHRKKLAAEC